MNMSLIKCGAAMVRLFLLLARLRSLLLCIITMWSSLSSSFWSFLSSLSLPSLPSSFWSFHHQHVQHYDPDRHHRPIWLWSFWSKMVAVGATLHNHLSSPRPKPRDFNGHRTSMNSFFLFLLDSVLMHFPKLTYHIETWMMWPWQ